MNFLVDAQLPKRLALWLKDHGHDAIHTLDLPRGNRSADDELMGIADAEQRVVVTKDADFVDSFQLHGRPARLLLISCGNLSNAGLEALIANHHEQIVGALDGASFVELSADRVIVHS